MYSLCVRFTEKPTVTVTKSHKFHCFFFSFFAIPNAFSVICCKQTCQQRQDNKMLILISREFFFRLLYNLKSCTLIPSEWTTCVTHSNSDVFNKNINDTPSNITQLHTYTRTNKLWVATLRHLIYKNICECVCDSRLPYTTRVHEKSQKEKHINMLQTYLPPLTL